MKTTDWFVVILFLIFIIIIISSPKNKIIDNRIENKDDITTITIYNIDGSIREQYFDKSYYINSNGTLRICERKFSNQDCNEEKTVTIISSNYKIQTVKK